ncbi:hypothetical protein OVN20_05355 [Microcella daejeonensis]|uniref:hypothetical protein n=1 Tax=Microcella daejeonensis TaxID=2994971 RepID=UPI00226E0BFA|nr:hypothetical protein [Microcella daejeonensis]WAB84979.1 hypothetical protein OVN20_05355 [Microcella daejeonensis]
MRRYRVLGTDGAGHVNYSALVTHAGRPRLHVTATGGAPATMTPVDEASAAAFTRAAQHLIGEDTGAAAELLRVITLAHTLREEARLASVDLDSIIVVRHIAGTLTDAEYDLLTR